MYQLYKRANEPHRYLLDDKLSQHWMLADTPENRPTAYGLIERGYVHGVAGSTFEGGAVPIDEWLPSKLREESPLVLKYLRGEAGKQVLVCDVDEKGFLLNERRVSESELCAELEPLTGYLVTEYVHQHEYADTLYPHSPNTIRILTIWDDDRRELLVPAAVQRIGTERSRPVDNFSIGGLSAEIDPETGTLSQAARYPRSGGVSWYSTHPDTDVQIEGVTVPHWDRIQSVVTSLATNATNIPIIGWDVLLDESSVPIVLEANTGTHFDVLQLHRPLLHDPDVARVFSRYLPSIDCPSSTDS
jgi:hypothetical protein